MSKENKKRAGIKCITCHNRDKPNEECKVKNDKFNKPESNQCEDYLVDHDLIYF